MLRKMCWSDQTYWFRCGSCWLSWCLLLGRCGHRPSAGGQETSPAHWHKHPDGHQGCDRPRKGFKGCRADNHLLTILTWFVNIGKYRRMLYRNLSLKLRIIVVQNCSFGSFAMVLWRLLLCDTGKNRKNDLNYCHFAGLQQLEDCIGLYFDFFT